MGSKKHTPSESSASMESESLEKPKKKKSKKDRQPQIMEDYDLGVFIENPEEDEAIPTWLQDNDEEEIPEESSESEPASIFSELPQALQQQLRQQGIVSPTPIQQAAIEPALMGQDILAQSQTGSGKTLAFAIPVGLRLAEPSEEGLPRALILTPTRELAAQVESVFAQTLGIFGLRCMHVIGGGSYARQKRQLKQGIDIVVGTPGRIVDLLQQGSLQLQGIEIYILDEVDQMLDIGFAEELEQIKQALPSEIQTLFFSATMNKPMEKLAKAWVKDPVVIKVAPGQTSPASIMHGYIPVQRGMEAPALMNALLYYNPNQALIFCATREECREITIALQQRGFNASALNGDMPQEARTETMDMFRNGALQYLVATNVAARGLDIQSLPLVINIDVPQDMEHYTHRSGRTGRAGEEGRSWTIITPRNYQRYWRFMKELKLQPERLNVPTHAEILKSIAQRDLQSLAEYTHAQIDRRIRKVVDDLLRETTPDVAHELLRGLLYKQLLQKQAHHTFNIAVEEGELGPSTTRRRQDDKGKRHRRSSGRSDRRFDEGEASSSTQTQVGRKDRRNVASNEASSSAPTQDRTSRTDRPRKTERMERRDRGENHEPSERLQKAESSERSSQRENKRRSSEHRSERKPSGERAERGTHSRAEHHSSPRRTSDQETPRPPRIRKSKDASTPATPHHDTPKRNAKNKQD